jgi:hypothetical protein
MKRSIPLAFLLMFVVPALGCGQNPAKLTEEEKTFLLDKAKRDIQDADFSKFANALDYLSALKEGPVIGKAAIACRAKQPDDYMRWFMLMRAYRVAMVKKTMADEMIPELVMELEKFKTQPALDLIESLGTFGAKAKAALPTLEWIVANGEQRPAIEARRALKKIKGQ